MTIDSDSARFARALRVAILWPVGAIFLTALFLLLLTLELFHAIKWHDHSSQVLVQTAKCENELIAWQNEARGYLLTERPVFIESFDRQSQVIDADFAKLRDLVSDNPSQVIRADDLIQAKSTWIQYVRNNISARVHGTVPDLSNVMLGKTMMDGILAKFGKFNSAEQQIYSQRLDQVKLMRAIFFYGGAAMIILLSIGVGQLVRRHFTNLASEHRAVLNKIEERHALLARSEADLEEQKEWFRVTLSSIGDGVIVTDGKGRIVFMNEEAERLTEWKSIEAMHKPLPLVFKIINENTRLSVENPMEKVFRERKVVGLTNHTVLVSAHGQECPIEHSAAPIQDSKGNLLGVVLVFHNATDMRRAQSTLQAYSENLEKKVTERTFTLQQAVTELEAFSYTISHDLRSPLRAMQGFAQAVLEDYGDKLDEDGKKYLDRIKNAAERLDRLIQDLLAYTRISQQEAPSIPLDLGKLINDIVENYPNLHPPEAQIEIRGEFPQVWGREAALTQVISNLLGNAAKFVRPGVMPQIKVWSETADSRVRLYIQDNGIGIAPRDFERIFQMFIQVNERSAYSGTGVGLAIVKKAVQTMHGSVGVESEEGNGSKFWVELNKA